MRFLSKALTLGVCSTFLLTGMANATSVPSSVKLNSEDRDTPRVATIHSTPLKQGENPFEEIFEVSVTPSPDPIEEPDESVSRSRSKTELDWSVADSVTAEAPPEPEPAQVSSGVASSSSSSSGSSGGSTSGSTASTSAIYSVEDLMFKGVINWGGYKFTYYSQSVLPGGGLVIPGRHVSDDGYVVDGDGYIALAGSAPKGTVYPTPFGRSGKIYDRGTYGNHLDVYTR